VIVILAPVLVRFPGPIVRPNSVRWYEFNLNPGGAYRGESLDSPALSAQLHCRSARAGIYQSNRKILLLSYDLLNSLTNIHHGADTYSNEFPHTGATRSCKKKRYNRSKHELLVDAQRESVRHTFFDGDEP
jgi:hypothetical protein